MANAAMKVSVTGGMGAEGCRRSQRQADVDVGGYDHKCNTYAHSLTYKEDRGHAHHRTHGDSLWWENVLPKLENEGIPRRTHRTNNNSFTGLPTFTQYGMSGSPLTIHQDKELTLDWNYLKDYCEKSSYLRE